MSDPTHIDPKELDRLAKVAPNLAKILTDEDP